MMLSLLVLSVLVGGVACATGCSHDGDEYLVGEFITVGCDQCICQPGEFGGKTY